MTTRSNRISTGVVIFAAVALFSALLLAAYFLYGRQFTEQDFTDDVSSPTLIAGVTATFAPTGTLPPIPTQTPQPPSPVPPSATIAPPAATATPTPANETINVFLIALGDNGAAGPPTGCGDSLVFTPRPIPPQPTASGRISAALTDLFSIRDQTYGDTGYYNALYQSQLTVDSVTLEAGVAVVNLSGTLQITDDCDRSRIEGQIEQTILQFTDVSGTQVFVNGVPLEVAVAGG